MGSERRYTLSEIDTMRDNLFEIARYNIDPEDWNDGFGSDDIDLKRIEDKLRTYLTAGIDPLELTLKREEAKAEHKAELDALKKAREEYKREQEERHRLYRESKKPPVFDSEKWTG